MTALTRFAQTVENFLTPIHKEGKLPGILSGVITLIAFLIYEAFGLLMLFVTCWVLYFFRNPDRVTPKRENIAVSPADGKVVGVTTAIPPKELGYTDERIKISVFLNVCDVHVNRIPVTGKIIKSQYRPGKFLSADMDKASEDNERQCLVIKDTADREVVCVQIAGLVARRIVCDAQEGMEYKAGDLYGIIRFGSRADIYLPLNSKVLIEEGQYMVGGETVLAELLPAEPVISAPEPLVSEAIPLAPEPEATV